MIRATGVDDCPPVILLFVRGMGSIHEMQMTKRSAKKVNINYPFALNRKLLSHSAASDTNNDSIVSSARSPYSTPCAAEGHVWDEKENI